MIRPILVIFALSTAWSAAIEPFEASSATAGTIDAFIYYDVADQAFERAAKTASKASAGREILHKVTTKADFIKAWDAIASRAKAGGLTIETLHIFSHASKQEDGQDGLEFVDGPGGSTLTRTDIGRLAKLPWAADGRIILHGCNTGLVGKRGWSPAQEFAKVQRVRATGETGYSYFSADSEVYRTITDKDTTVYLAAYRRGRNSSLGNGKRMETKSFQP